MTHPTRAPLRPSLHALLTLAAGLLLAACAAGGRTDSGRRDMAPQCTYEGLPCTATCCGNVCTRVDNDPLNCGACGVACPSGTACLEGHCGCPPYGSVCGTGQSCCAANGCVSLDSDIKNCGACGVTCPDGVSCVGGSCAGSSAPAAPPAGFCSCDDSCASDSHHLCIGDNCCYDQYRANNCSPSTSCGLWTYP